MPVLDSCVHYISCCILHRKENLARAAFIAKHLHCKSKNMSWILTLSSIFNLLMFLSMSKLLDVILPSRLYIQVVRSKAASLTLGYLYLTLIFDSLFVWLSVVLSLCQFLCPCGQFDLVFTWKGPDRMNDSKSSRTLQTSLSRGQMVTLHSL